MELVGVHKGDVGCAALPNKLKVMDVLLCRGRRISVKAVTGGGRPDEIYGGRDLIVMNEAFNFNARRVKAQRCSPVIVKAKRGFLPKSVLQPFRPVSLKFSFHPQLKSIGSLKITFTSLAFNKFLVCHRDSHVRHSQLPRHQEAHESV